MNWSWFCILLDIWFFNSNILSNKFLWCWILNFISGSCATFIDQPALCDVFHHLILVSRTFILNLILYFHSSSSPSSLLHILFFSLCGTSLAKIYYHATCWSCGCHCRILIGWSQMTLNLAIWIMLYSPICISKCYLVYYCLTPL